jgi:hypothetical protein
MDRSQIHALIEDGPRGGETFDIDAEADSPPSPILLPDRHDDDSREGHPAPGVSTDRLSGRDEQRGGYVYKVVPNEG